jgi:hypothetical protein
MGAWLWTGNPNRWKANPSVTGYEAMRSYLEDECGYVYWATPKNRDRVEVGDCAYIWRSKSQYDDRNGIVAVGTVEEKPREYTGHNKDEFRYPKRIEAAGWDEDRASSRWKTGIKIQQNLWTRALYVPGLVVRESINPLSNEQCRQIEECFAK